jgi:integrase
VGSNKKAAEEIRGKVESDLLRDNFGLEKRKDVVSLKSLVDRFLKSKSDKVRESTITRYKNYLNRLNSFFDDLFPVPATDISKIQLSYLEEFVDEAQKAGKNGDKAWSKATVNDGITAIKTLFKFAAEREFITKNPALLLEPVREKSQGRPDYFSDEELEKIWANLPAHWVDALKFLAETGLRKGELMNLRWDKADLSSGAEQITVETTDDYETKTGNSRIVPLTKVAIEILNRQKGKHAKFVFTGPQGGPVTRDKI